MTDQVIIQTLRAQVQALESGFTHMKKANELLIQEVAALKAELIRLQDVVSADDAESIRKVLR